MIRRGALFAVPLSAIVLLLLNLRERDVYEGSPTPLPVELKEEAPEGLALPCGHPAEIRQTRVLRLRDHDGWYRLFWAGDDLYYYEDGVHFAAAFYNGTACDPWGEWTISAVCARCATSKQWHYRLEVSDSEFTDPGTLPWFVYQYSTRDRSWVRHFGWRLSE